MQQTVIKKKLNRLFLLGFFIMWLTPLLATEEPDIDTGERNWLLDFINLVNFQKDSLQEARSTFSEKYKELIQDYCLKDPDIINEQPLLNQVRAITGSYLTAHNYLDVYHNNYYTKPEYIKNHQLDKDINWLFNKFSFSKEQNFRKELEDQKKPDLDFLSSMVDQQKKREAEQLRKKKETEQLENENEQLRISTNNNDEDDEKDPGGINKALKRYEGQVKRVNKLHPEEPILLNNNNNSVEDKTSNLSSDQKLEESQNNQDQKPVNNDLENQNFISNQQDEQLENENEQLRISIKKSDEEVQEFIQKREKNVKKIIGDRNKNLAPFYKIQEDQVKRFSKLYPEEHILLNNNNNSVEDNNSVKDKTSNLSSNQEEESFSESPSPYILLSSKEESENNQNQEPVSNDLGNQNFISNQKNELLNQILNINEQNELLNQILNINEQNELLRISIKKSNEKWHQLIQEREEKIVVDDKNKNLAPFYEIQEDNVKSFNGLYPKHAPLNNNSVEDNNSVKDKASNLSSNQEKEESFSESSVEESSYESPSSSILNSPEEESENNQDQKPVSNDLENQNFISNQQDEQLKKETEQLRISIKKSDEEVQEFIKKREKNVKKIIGDKNKNLAPFYEIQEDQVKRFSKLYPEEHILLNNNNNSVEDNNSVKDKTSNLSSNQEEESSYESSVEESSYESSSSSILNSSVKESENNQDQEPVNNDLENQNFISNQQDEQLENENELLKISKKKNDEELLREKKKTEQLEKETAQLENETEQLKKETAQLKISRKKNDEELLREKKKTEQLEKETEQLEKETEQLKKETAQLKISRKKNDEELLREKKKTEQLEKETEQLEKETEQLKISRKKNDEELLREKKEIEQLKKETEQLKKETELLIINNQNQELNKLQKKKQQQNPLGGEASFSPSPPNPSKVIVPVSPLPQGTGAPKDLMRSSMKRLGDDQSNFIKRYGEATNRTVEIRLNILKNTLQNQRDQINEQNEQLNQIQNKQKKELEQRRTWNQEDEERNKKKKKNADRRDKEKQMLQNLYQIANKDQVFNHFIKLVKEKKLKWIREDFKADEEEIAFTYKRDLEKNKLELELDNYDLGQTKKEESISQYEEKQNLVKEQKLKILNEKLERRLKEENERSDSDHLQPYQSKEDIEALQQQNPLGGETSLPTFHNLKQVEEESGSSSQPSRESTADLPFSSHLPDTSSQNNKRGALISFFILGGLATFYLLIGYRIKNIKSKRIPTLTKKRLPLEQKQPLLNPNKKKTLDLAQEPTGRRKIFTLKHLKVQAAAIIVIGLVNLFLGHVAHIKSPHPIFGQNKNRSIQFHTFFNILLSSYLYWLIEERLAIYLNPEKPKFSWLLKKIEIGFIAYACCWPLTSSFFLSYTQYLFFQNFDFYLIYVGMITFLQGPVTWLLHKLIHYLMIRIKINTYLREFYTHVKAPLLVTVSEPSHQ